MALMTNANWFKFRNSYEMIFVYEAAIIISLVMEYVYNAPMYLSKIIFKYYIKANNT
jgi:hypothetical protein